MKSEIIKAIQKGLPINSTPWETLARSFNIPKQELIQGTIQAIKEKSIKRFGLVIKHRTLGYNSNAMVVWDIPDEQIETIGKKMAEYSFVRLCYQRPRVLPDWPYNLFCMVHSKDRQTALQQIEKLKLELNLQSIKTDILFSKRCFKQSGARYR